MLLLSSPEYTGDTDMDSIINTPEEKEILDSVPLVEIPQHIDPDNHVEFFECVNVENTISLLPR